MKFAPEYVTHVLNVNFEDAKELLLSPLMAINYAHLVMLAEQGIISAGDARSLRDALDGISLDRVRDVKYDGTYEDLFFYIERLIDQACGVDVAGRLHTARSRNDLAMTMYRMRQREFILGLGEALLNLRGALVALAERHKDSIYGAHTHTQPAQPTTVAHYLLAIIEQLERDTVRLGAAFESTNRNPLGACAITGTGFPINRDRTVSRERRKKRPVVDIKVVVGVEPEHERAERFATNDQRQHHTGTVAAGVGEHRVTGGAFGWATQVNRLLRSDRIGCRQRRADVEPGPQLHHLRVVPDMTDDLQRLDVSGAQTQRAPIGTDGVASHPEHISGDPRDLHPLR